MKKQILIALLFIFALGMAFGHNENATKLTLQSCSLINEWKTLSDSADRFSQFLIFLDSYEAETFPVWELRDEDRRIIEALKAACKNQDEDSINWLLVEHATLEKNLSDYKNGKLTILVSILSIVLSVFLCRVIYFAISFFNSSRREKFTKAVNKHIIQIQETERRRLSHELHDTVAQDLKGISLISKSPEIDRLAGKAIADIRAICYNLTPPELDCGQLTDAIAIITDDFKKSTGIELPLVITDTDYLNSFSKEAQLNIFRIIQESLENIKLHAKASEASVIIRRENSTLSILICDDGTGFNPETTGGHRQFGLRNIRERTEMMNGKCSINSEESFGTEIKIVIPGERK